MNDVKYYKTILEQFLVDKSWYWYDRRLKCLGMSNITNDYWLNWCKIARLASSIVLEMQQTADLLAHGSYWMI